ncbi:hypothetical protein SAG0039_09470 [Streptococcus agalactiae FSL S3-014]|nr:hypothetical protein SAG0039_09470 [Streptococcus agalactiae FSL S3-014]
MFKSNYERKMRYSIRKFSVGVASVAVASLFMGSVAHASELVKDDSVKTTEVAAKRLKQIKEIIHHPRNLRQQRWKFLQQT